jgi:DMSO/TMAO reductase YedYZ molybdopterin-dependent catalytic subunit
MMKPEKERIPPNQVVTEKFPTLHVGSVPKFDPKTWEFSIAGLVRNPLTLNWEGFLKLPKTVSTSDFHCVTGWSRLDNKWEGVLFKTIHSLVKPFGNAKYVTVVAERDYTTSLPIEELMDDDVILAYRFNGSELKPEHGGPLRLVVPKKYAYKSAKWVKKLAFTERQELGYWEVRGYSNTADPWKEERYS